MIKRRKDFSIIQDDCWLKKKKILCSVEKTNSLAKEMFLILTSENQCIFRCVFNTALLFCATKV